MVLIYTDKITNRIKYIFNLFFEDILNTEYEITTDQESFSTYAGAKLSYGKKMVGSEMFFAADNLLFERGIRHIDINMLDYESLPAFFPVYHKESTFPFDPFSAAFYLVSRYEEYLPYRKDKYGRFSATESIAYNKGFLQKPMVNIWALKIGQLLKDRFPGYAFNGFKYKFQPTIDVDAAWAFKQKGIFRISGGYINSLRKLDINDFLIRTKVLLGSYKDPFDTFDYQLEIHRKYNLKAIYFILFADYGFNDKNIPVQSRKFQTLIKSLADYAEIGIHPSYNSNDYPKKLGLEISRLSKVLNREISKSRQHFLKIQLPATYRNLINFDITDDYSMGYAARPGFRASICSDFNFYDLDLDIETKLRIHPFMLMDGTLQDYMGIGTEDAMQHIRPLINEVKAVNGTFISLWHNDSLSDTNRWKGWKSIYENMIMEALL